MRCEFKLRTHESVDQFCHLVNDPEMNWHILSTNGKWHERLGVRASANGAKKKSINLLFVLMTNPYVCERVRERSPIVDGVILHDVATSATYASEPFFAVVTVRWRLRYWTQLIFGHCRANCNTGLGLVNGNDECDSVRFRLRTSYHASIDCKCYAASEKQRKDHPEDDHWPVECAHPTDKSARLILLFFSSKTKTTEHCKYSNYSNKSNPFTWNDPRGISLVYCKRVYKHYRNCVTI